MRFPIIRESVRAGGQERQAYVYTVTEAEYMEKFRQEDNRTHLLRFSEKVRHCKVDIFEKFAHGTIAVPAAGDPDRNGQGRYIRFYMDGEKLILIKRRRSAIFMRSPMFFQGSWKSEGLR